MTLNTLPTPPPAPGETQHPALALANTRFNAGGELLDGIRTVRLANQWLAEHVRHTRLDYQKTIALQQLRDAIRTMFGCFADGAPAPVNAVDALNAALRRVPTIPQLHWSAAGPWCAHAKIAGTPAERAFADIAADAVDLLTSDDALAACGAPHCIRFLLRTHGKRQWCSTRCGNRVRAARHYTHTRAAR